jgi:TRAP-type C4-dicarboxylate transport system substrate-binding protein
MTRLTLQMNDEYVKKFKDHGVTFVEDVDLAAFQRATAPAYKAFPKWTPGLHDRVMSVIKR